MNVFPHENPSPALMSPEEQVYHEPRFLMCSTKMEYEAHMLAKRPVRKYCRQCRNWAIAHTVQHGLCVKDRATRFASSSIFPSRSIAQNCLSLCSSTPFFMDILLWCTLAMISLQNRCIPIF